MSNYACQFCGAFPVGTVGGVWACDAHAKLVWIAIKGESSPPQLASLKARSIVERLIGTLGEVGNGTTDEELREALTDVFSLRETLWPERAGPVASTASELDAALAKAVAETKTVTPLALCEHRSVYECAECHEQRCMECDAPTQRDEIKTAVRWCPKHRYAGERGFPQPHELSADERLDLRWVRGYLVARADPNTKRLGEVVALLERLGREP